MTFEIIGLANEENYDEVKAATERSHQGLNELKAVGDKVRDTGAELTAILPALNDIVASNCG